MSTKVQAPSVVDVNVKDILEILKQARERTLTEEEAGLLRAITESYAYVLDEIGSKDASIRRLQRMIFGSKTEKTKDIVGKRTGPEAPPTSQGEVAPIPSKKKRKGHGRKAASAYTAATKVKVPHGDLHHGDGCPECPGKLYLLKKPGLLVRVVAQPPFAATVYEKERLRCKSCGGIFVAASPEGVGEDKYDEGAVAMVALLHYGSGMPFYRLQELQRSLGVPLPASVQWELALEGARKLESVHDELMRQAAQGRVLYNDDTAMRILECFGEDKKKRERGEKPERSGTYTSGIVSEGKDQRIVLYCTGRRHAGENLAAVLKRRAAELDPPLQMCDGLDRNLPGELKTVVANCLVHARRHFVDVAESFPEEVRHVLEELALVYKVDARAKQEGLSAEERLRLHQEESGPVMDRLETWMQAMVDERKVEPNSALGEAIAYAQKRWERMKLFLREPGAPLDNSLCEQVLKRAILHRKNSLFYKTENGARVGDLYMSLIATAKLAEVDPFDYLTKLLRHAKEAAANPADWMPWTYRETLARPPQPP